MPIVAVVVGVIGSAIGTAIGAAVGGTILGISAATIGGVIGAGIAGGALSYMSGGSFGKGFLMGAGGAALGSFLSAGLGDAVGSTVQAADGTTQAAMLAEQSGAYLDSAGNLVEGGLGDMAASGITDATAGLSTAGDMSVAPTAEGSFSLDQLGQAQVPQMSAEPTSTSMGLDAINSASTGNMMPTAGADAFASPTTGFNADSYSLTQGATPGIDTSGSIGDYSMMPETPYAQGTTPQTGTSLEGIGTQGAQPTAPTTGLAATTAATAGAPASQGIGNTIKGYMKSSDDWLANTFGSKPGSTGKLLMGGADSLMKLYEAHKLESQVKKTAPLSFEEFQAQYSDPNAYKIAANTMAKGGRTGTLPALLARMQNDARGKYASYLPGAQQQYLQNKAGIAGAKVGALNSLFGPYAQYNTSKA